MQALTPNNAQLNGDKAADISQVQAILKAILDDKEAHRNRLIDELRHTEKFLIKYGRMQQETLPRRVR